MPFQWPIRIGTNPIDVYISAHEKLGLKPYPANGNYMLVDATMTGKTTAEILDAAIKMEKVYLKRIGDIHGKSGYFRITPGTNEENERFIKFARAYFG